ncbi:hypothetical protein FZI94_28455 [Mycobacterium sp. CBMA226]|nr:hypothetical protein [Mycolicibacterium sp. CBMA 226]
MASGLLIAGMGGANAFADSVASGGDSSDHGGGASHDVTKPGGSSTAGGGQKAPRQPAKPTDGQSQTPSTGGAGSDAKKDKQGASGGVAKGGSEAGVQGPGNTGESGKNASENNPSSKQKDATSPPSRAGESGTSNPAAGEHQPSAGTSPQQSETGTTTGTTAPVTTGGTSQPEPGTSQSQPAATSGPAPSPAAGVPGIQLPSFPNFLGLPALPGLPQLPGLPSLPALGVPTSGSGSPSPASPTSPTKTPVKPTPAEATTTINLMGLTFSLPAAAVHTSPTGAVQSIDLTKIPLASLVPRLPQWDQLPQLPDMSNIPILAQLAAIPVFVLARIEPVYEFVAGLTNATLDVATSLPFMQTSISMLGGQVVPSMDLGRQNRMPALPVAGLPAVAAVPDTPAFPALKLDSPVVVSAPAEVPVVRSPQPTTFGAKHEIMAQPAFRAGYPDYLRAAGLSEVAAVAVPGFTGILILTGAGGLVGYRQARAGHVVRRSGIARFMT